VTRTTAQRVLIVSAAGGIGTTICELGQLGGLVMYGVEASRILECGVSTRSADLLR
jgi:NADPH:quinone reductase-like Zn-dependent oxidoreductase